MLAACSHSGLVKEGLPNFRPMCEEYSDVPAKDRYNCVIDLLSGAGHLDDLYDLIKFPQLRQYPLALGSLVG